LLKIIRPSSADHLMGHMASWYPQGQTESLVPYRIYNCCATRWSDSVFI